MIKPFVALLCGILALNVVMASSDLTLDFKFVKSDMGCTIEQATNSHYPKKWADKVFLGLYRITLAPCAVRTMHLHRCVDEFIICMSGRCGAGVAYPDGKVIKDELRPGRAFAFPRDYIHTVYNPDCHSNAVYYGILNDYDGKTSNVVAAAYNMPASPFRSYVWPSYTSSIEKAIGTFAYDPYCLWSCGWSSGKWGMQPYYSGSP